MKRHQAMMRFEERRQRDDESIDRFLDDLESLRRRSDLEESTNRRNFSVASKFFDGMKNDDLRTCWQQIIRYPKIMHQLQRRLDRNMQRGGQQQRSIGTSLDMT